MLIHCYKYPNIAPPSAVCFQVHGENYTGIRLIICSFGVKGYNLYTKWNIEYEYMNCLLQTDCIPFNSELLQQVICSCATIKLYLTYLLHGANTWKFWNLLEKDGEDQLDQSHEKRRSITWSQVGKEHPPYCKTKGGWLDWSHFV